MIDSFGGRKFIFAILATILGFGLVLSGYLFPADWLDFVKFLLATYVVGNVATKVTDTFTTDK
jgi:hypothetical protein